MASGDFLDLAEQACRAAQLDPTDTTGDLAQAKAKINEGYLSCMHSGDPWDLLEKEGQWTTTAGGDTYTYATIATAMGISGASIREIHMLVNDTEGYPLESTSWEYLESLAYSSQESSEGTGCPTYWSKWGSQGSPRIRLYPSPDQVYEIGTFCYLTPVELSADGDTPLIPLAWRHKLLVSYAAWKLLSQEGGTEARTAARDYRDEYTEAFIQMRTALATAKAPTFNVTQPGFFERRDNERLGAWW